MNYIAVSLYRKIIFHAIHEGMPRKDFAQLPIPIDRLDQVQAVPADQFFAVHEMIDQALPSGFSVRVGQEMKMEDYGVLGLSWRTCSRAGEIFERCERYFKLLSNTYLFKVIREEDISKVILFRDAHRRGVELSNESTLSATVVVLKAMTETNITPLEVAFKHRPPKDLKSYSDAFQCAVKFHQPENYIAYSTDDLNTRTAKADQSIHEYLLQRVDEETKGIEVGANRIASDVERLIEDALPSGIPSITQLCEHLGMSARTLTRRLSESGCTFRDLIRQTQQKISMNLLRERERSIGEIAFLTGFSEQSAFNRAFKRWTGQSPLEFRKIN